VKRFLSTTTSTGTLYFSMLAGIKGNPTLTPVQYYGVGGSVGSTSTTACANPGWNSTGYPYWGLLVNGAHVWSGNTITLPMTTMMVVKIEFDKSGSYDTISLFVNPTITQASHSEPTPLVTSTAYDVGGITRLEACLASAMTFSENIDEIRIGQTWADVTPVVPEPSTLALLAAGLVGLLAYAWRKRK
jgi:hypothetical protein